MWGTKPMYRSIASYNFNQHAGSVLHGKATDGTSIGLITPDNSTPQKTTTKSTK
jgi:hypothetical protein